MTTTPSDWEWRRCPPPLEPKAASAHEHTDMTHPDTTPPLSLSLLLVTNTTHSEYELHHGRTWATAHRGDGMEQHTHIDTLALCSCHVTRRLTALR